jgi:ABC-2 type transport system ATP-binding protein
LVLDLRARGHAVIISTHNLDEAERVADRVGVLRRRFLAVASPTDLRHRLFGSRALIRVSGDAAAFSSVIEREGAREVEAEGERLRFAVDDLRTAMPPIVSALVAAGAAVLEVTSEEAALEDVYLTLVAGDEQRQGSA